MNRKLNVVLVGLGFGGAFVPIYKAHPDIASIGLYDTNPDVLKKFADRYGIRAELSIEFSTTVEGKNGKAEKGEELTGNLRMEYVFGKGTYNADSAAEKAKKEGERKGFGLEIGSGSFIDGFEDAMIGMSVQEGTKKVLTLKFPDP